MASDRLHVPQGLFRRERTVRMRGRANRWERMMWNEDAAGCLTLIRIAVTYANGLHKGGSLPLVSYTPR